MLKGRQVMNRILIAATMMAGVGIVGACAAENEQTPRKVAPPVEIAGDPVNCVQTRNIRSSKVQDDSTIDFEMVGGTVLRNALPNSCPGLSFEGRFAHSSTTGQLCNVDTVTLLYSDGRRGVSCGLGQFVPVRYKDAAS